VQRLCELPEFELVFDSRTRGLTVLLAKLFLKHHGFFCCLPGYLFSDRRPPGRWRRPHGIAARMLSLAEAATRRPPEWQGTFEVSEAARALAVARLPDGPTYVGLAAGSREAKKNWPLDRFIALARALQGSGRVPVFLIGPQEQGVLDELRRALPTARFPEAEPVDPALGLARLELAVAIGQRLAAAVANDSGIGHLLGAINTPLVSLFGPTDSARWAPFTTRGIIVRAQDFGGTSMDTIPVGAVVGAVNGLVWRGNEF
jgi:ADP-heptose:LPS heptosyltransferase